ncbi:MAG: nucleoside hydrolase [Bacteroidota bacterium]
MSFPRITDEEILARLAPPAGRVRMVLDTDTYNEVDDQFALVYALSSPERLAVEAVYAAPFHNEKSTGPADGMERSYREIVRLLGKMDRPHQGFVYRGSDRYLPGAETPVESEAARDLVRRAMAGPADQPLYVAAIGAITNVASALLMRPEIVRRIVVVWLGGHPLHWEHTREFNLAQDVPAARVVLDSGVPLVLVPCLGVASHLLTSLPELEAHLAGRSAVCDALVELYRAYAADHFGFAKEIWDLAAVAYLVNPGWVPTVLAPSPVLTDQVTWSEDRRRHLIRVATFVRRNEIFKDLFRKLLGAG